MARLLSLARFGGCATVSRWWGYYGAHLRARIWDAFFVEGCTTQRLPLGGKLSPKVTDEGATELPNGAEEAFRWGDRREPPLFYKERLGTGSPPHPTRLRRPTYGLWWLRLDLTEQSPGLFDPRGEGFGGGNAPSRLRNHASQPAQLGGGPLRAWDKWAAGQAEKEGGPPQGPPNQSRESRGEKLSPLALFPPVSREKRGPPPGRRPTGRCAPRPRKSPAHP